MYIMQTFLKHQQIATLIKKYNFNLWKMCVNFFFIYKFSCVEIEYIDSINVYIGS